MLELTVRLARIWVVPDYAIAWYAPSPIPGVPYGLKRGLRAVWGLGEVRTNRDGIRDDRALPPGQRDPQVTRILAVGDSITFGFGVDQPDSYPAQLEQGLAAASGRSVEVINAGVNGYSLRDTARALPALLDRYRPDVIVWTLVPNDYDDSFAVRPDGLVTRPVEDNAFASTSEFALGQDAAKPADFDDFRHSMTEAALRWADGTPAPATPVTTALERSYLFRWTRSLAASLPAGMPMATADAIAGQPPRQNAWTDPAGRRHPFPAHVALFSHPTRLASFNGYLAEARALAAARTVPLVVVNTNLPIAAAHRTRDRYYAYFDSAVLLGQPFGEFHAQHNLRWDPHFSPQGNLRFAQAVQQAIACAQAGETSGACASLTQRQADYESYWRAFEASQRAFRARFGSAVDLDGYAGFPQIVGGIYPPRQFPNDISHRAEFLLAEPRDAAFHLDMTNGGTDSIALTVTLRRAGRTVVHDLVVPNGRLDARLDVSDLRAVGVADDLLEVSLACKPSACGTARLHFIGTR